MTPAMPAQIRALVADDDPTVRSLHAMLLGGIEGVSRVLEAEHGAEAVRLAREVRIHVAVLDLNMPQLDGVEAALQLRAIQPWMGIALQSSDPELLRERAAGLGLPLFDEHEVERLVEWVHRQVGGQRGSSSDGNPSSVSVAQKLELVCSRCGYGIISRRLPEWCPMCHTAGAWDEPRHRRAQSSLHR